MYYIGIDLGTSAVKLLLVDENGGILNTVTREYPLEFPQPGWSQQNPEDWKRAVFEGAPQLLQGFDGAQVAGIGCGGQMHGLVVLVVLIQHHQARCMAWWCWMRTTR